MRIRSTGEGNSHRTPASAPEVAIQSVGRRPIAAPEPPAGQRAEHADAVVHEHVRTGDPGTKLGRDHRGEDRARTDVQQHHPETRAELGEEEQGEDRALRSRCERDEQERCGEDHAADREARPEADRPGDPTGDDGADETAHRTGAEDEPERARSDAELARRVEHEEREEDEVEEVDRRGREQGRPHERRADHEANAAADAASLLVGRRLLRRDPPEQRRRAEERERVCQQRDGRRQRPHEQPGDARAGHIRERPAAVEERAPLDEPITRDDRDEQGRIGDVEEHAQRACRECDDEQVDVREASERVGERHRREQERPADVCGDHHVPPAAVAVDPRPGVEREQQVRRERSSGR